MAWASIFIALSCVVTVCYGQGFAISCTDEFGQPQRCVPPFQNIAYNKFIDVTNTCGLSARQEYCYQIGSGERGEERDTLECRLCYEGSYSTSHSARFLTDFNNNDNKTWWQSETMLEGIQYPNSVNLTLSLGKQFEITYIRLRFKARRPESMVMFKKTTTDGEWVPYQYFSASCEKTYGLRRDMTITPADETKALCTDQYSQLTPLTGGTVLFSTLEGRPSASEFEQSRVLQEFVTATDIRITLNRINTYGDEVFQVRKVLQSYFYAISDFAVGGRCKCNGHASSCTPSTGGGLESYACTCEHNTMGINCEQCAPFYNDRPWAMATAASANECRACNCNGRSNRCYFDDELYRRTGHGGHCISCQGNTTGVNCERCRDNFFRYREQDACQPCECDAEGSLGPQCDEAGQCRCKPGVTGPKCDRCDANFYDFGPFGCRQCECRVEGSLDNQPICSSDTGDCRCKEYVEGKNCDTCKPGFFGLTAANPLGCHPCFCYGHSSDCSSARGYVAQVTQSDFSSGAQRWRGATQSDVFIDLRYDGFAENVAVSAPSTEPIYFIAPERYLGDQRFSYSRNLSFTLRIGEEGAGVSVSDVIIEGDGVTVRAPIYAQGNPLPRTVAQEYNFVLHEHPSYQWTPSVSSREFIRMLSNLRSIRIRATYTRLGSGFLDDVKLESATNQNVLGSPVSHVEQCRCLDGYVGQFCEDCAAGYRREPVNGGPFARCVPCNCHGHSDQCDVNTGKCICQHNTEGDNCERCKPGYYGYALRGRPDDCQPCPCPDAGECVELMSGEVACINCQLGYTGNRCEMCADGYFGDPLGRFGTRRPCERCRCNDNVDPNAINNCNSTTGECRKCIFNTGGFSCENCLPGFYGDAQATPKGDQCQACDCYRRGTIGGLNNNVLTCDSTGACRCLRNVVGQHCDACREGFWNLDSGTGCENCDCDATGSYNRSCDVYTGQCHCKPGVTGLKCDQCQANHYAFSSSGCRACECNPDGSTTLQCNLYTGDCLCKPNIDGRHCDQCMENKHDLAAGCVDCPPCYDLVQDAVNHLRVLLRNLSTIIDNIGDNPRYVDDEAFERRLSEVNDSVNQLLEDARNALGGDNSTGRQLEAMRAALVAITETCARIHTDLVSGQSSAAQAAHDVSAAEQLIEAMLQQLRDAEVRIDDEGRDALEKAKQAQEEAGQQNDRLTAIAQEAQQLAQGQLTESAEIVSIANEALNTSREAMRIAQEALDVPDDTKQKVDGLDRDMASLQAMYEQTLLMSESALQQATQAFDDSAAVSVRADALLQSLDIDALRQEAADINQTASNTKDEAARLIAEHEALIRAVQQQKLDAEALLAEGEQEQQVTDELLANADKALEIARNAVAKAEGILKVAQDTLDTLNGFNEFVEASKDKAEEALKLIPVIEQQIEEAEDATAEANDNLADAERDANIAKTAGANAAEVGTMAAQEASSIRDAAEAASGVALELNINATTLSGQVDDAEQRLEKFENNAEADDVATEALQKAERAQNAADDAARLAENALGVIENITNILASLDEIDVDALEQLERDLAQADEDLKASNLSERLAAIERARNEQYYYRSKFTDELKALNSDVENIRIINETLPRECFRPIKLEPGTGR